MDSKTFWAVSAHMSATGPDRNLAAMVNATPFTYFRFGSAGDSTNQTSGVTYSSNGAPGPAAMNDSALVTWCRWLGARCHAIWVVPGEINDPKIAAQTVKYVEHKLRFHPTYWSIGNEPTGWTHYNVKWTEWRSTDASACSTGCYASVVQRYVPAMRAVDSKIRFIGIQASSCGGNAYLYDVVRVNGRNLSAVACHQYPATGLPNATLGAFFGALNGSSSLIAKIPGARATIQQACPACRLPLFVDEYNADARAMECPAMNSSADVPFLAAAAIQALELNLSQFAYFTLADPSSALVPFDLIAPNDTARWNYGLYTDILGAVPLPSVLSTTVETNLSGVYGVATESPTEEGLLVVNTNTTTALELSVAGTAFGTGSIGTARQWDPTLSAPTSANYGSLPENWTIPSEGVLLLTVIA